MMSGALALALTVGLLSGIVPAKRAGAETLTTLETPTVTDFAAQITSAQATVTLQGGTATASDTILPVHVSQAGVLEIAVTGTSLTSSVEMGFFSDAGCQTAAGSTATVYGNSSQSVKKTYQIAAEGVYYLRFRWASSIPSVAGTLQVQAVSYCGKELNLNETSQAVYTEDAAKTLYHKLTVKKDGVVTVSGGAYQEVGTSLQASSLYIQLCNKNKKSLTNATLSSLNLYSENFALKKGTYYVAVTSGLRYQLSSSVNTWKDRSGTKQSKAKLIRKKKTVKGMIALTDSTKKVDWFKIKISKRSKIQLNVAAVCTGTSSNMKVEIVPANKHYTLLNASVLLGTTGRKLKSRSKLNAGVYYIKVTKLTKSCSGVYGITYAK